MQLSFEDRTYLVTGGGSGIGKGVAAALVASGANVMLMGRNADRLAAAADEIKAGGPGSVNYEPADITNEDEVSRTEGTLAEAPSGAGSQSPGRVPWEHHTLTRW